MSYSAEEIHAIVEGRRRKRGSVIEAMREIRDVYNTDIVVPLPEMDKTERPFVPNLILTGIDQTATRAASVQPMLRCPPDDPMDELSVERAAIRRNAIFGWWEYADLEIADAQRARWLSGYGSYATIIRPDIGKGLPCWEIRDPLAAYPPPPTGNPVRDMAPKDCAFIVRHTYAWLASKYPAAPMLLRGRRPNEIDPSELFEVIEWFDEHEAVIVGLANPVHNPYYSTGVSGVFGMAVELDRMQNLIGECQVVMPGRITLDRPRGQFDGAIGQYHAQSKLMALGLIAVERDVFPDMFLISRQPGETPRFIRGPFDGRTGEWNEVEGLPQAVGQPTGALTTNMIDRLERAQGVNSFVASEFGGESNTNIRTARRGRQVMGAQIDFMLAEIQMLMARAREIETRLAQKIAQAWFGKRQVKLYVKVADRSVTYVPDRDFDSDVVAVEQPLAGTDSENLTIQTGQMIGTRQMSRRTSMALSPLIKNPEQEQTQIEVEALEDAGLAAVLTQAQAGQITPPDLAKLIRYRKQGMSIEDAFDRVNQEAQERQASSGEPGTPAGPVPPGSPEAQPGLALPGMGGEQPTEIGPRSLQAALAAAFGGG